ncbi:hypothetical protein ACZ90_13000 [Streptomyces albus subsp. albus]|nr:hypothetical protein ACZ90_13000 [Streptomyces albus subsp. albus]
MLVRDVSAPARSTGRGTRSPRAGTLPWPVSLRGRHRAGPPSTRLPSGAAGYGHVATITGATEGVLFAMPGSVQ